MLAVTRVSLNATMATLSRFVRSLAVIKLSLIDSNAEKPTRRKVETSHRERLSEMTRESVMQQSEHTGNEPYEAGRNDRLRRKVSNKGDAFHGFETRSVRGRLTTDLSRLIHW
jgi:hypothetical protein